MGTPPAKCQVLDLTKDTGLPDVATEALSEIAEKLNLDPGYWGDKGNMVFIVTDPNTELWVIGLAMEIIGLMDEWPLATILIGKKPSQGGICVYSSEDGMSIGQHAMYAIEDEETGCTTEGAERQD